jgi:hypothetical protein
MKELEKYELLPGLNRKAFSHATFRMALVPCNLYQVVPRAAHCDLLDNAGGAKAVMIEGISLQNGRARNRAQMYG